MGVACEMTARATEEVQDQKEEYQGDGREYRRDGSEADKHPCQHVDNGQHEKKDDEYVCAFAVYLDFHQSAYMERGM